MKLNPSISEIDRNVAVVMPAYNEATTIRNVIQPLLNYVQHIIVVDDGSKDQTVAQIQDLPITILRNSINQGKAKSMLRGFSHAKSLNVQAIITLDADAQHDPHDIARFIEAMHQYPQHILIGARTINQKNAPKSRYMANRCADFFISWAAGHRILDTQSGYRLYPTNLISQLRFKRSYEDSFVFESEILIDAARLGCFTRALAIRSYYPENARQSYYRPITDTVKISWMLGRKILARGLCLKGLYTVLSSEIS